MVNGIDEIVVTKLDVLDDLDTLKICTAYRFKGKTYRDFPAGMTMLASCEPVYEELPGWKADTTRITSFPSLPGNARQYLKRIQEILKTKIVLISVGSERKQTFSKGV